MALAMIAVFTVLGVIISALSIVKVVPAGITGTTFVGWRKRTAWYEIESVDYISFSGITYLGLRVRGHRLNLYLPAEIKRGKQFDELVLRFAGRRNPLSEWLLPDNAG
jgi:hypothetical protein